MKVSPRQRAAEMIEELGRAKLEGVPVNEFGEIQLADLTMGLWCRNERGATYLEFKSAEGTAYVLAQLQLEDFSVLAKVFTAAARIAEEAIGAGGSRP